MVCVIDGDNVAFAMVGEGAELKANSVRQFRTSDFPTFTDALQNYTRANHIGTGDLPLGLAAAHRRQLAGENERRPAQVHRGCCCQGVNTPRSPGRLEAPFSASPFSTLSSWAGQLRASQPGTASSGPFACRAAFTSAAAGATLTSATAGVTQAPPSHTGVVKL